LVAAGSRAIVIVNPYHGDHQEDGGSITKLLTDDYLGNDAISAGILLRRDMTADKAMACYKSHGDHHPVFIHAGFSEPKALATALGDELQRTANVFIDTHATLLYRKHFDSSERFLVKDGFKRQKNADYDPVEAFSDLHVIYKDLGMSGFGDFLTVGDAYSEGGGPAYAVAIHLTFIDPDRDDEMYIYHFVSDTNSTPTDPAGKFAQALAKDREERYPSAGALASDLRTAIADEAPATVAAPTDRPTLLQATARPQKRRWGWIAAAAVLIALATLAAVIWATRDSSSGGSATDLRPFVDRVENVLTQAAAGRSEIASAIRQGSTCKITNADAAQRIASVADNRQSILQQLAGLSGPTPATDRMATLLQQGLQASFEADRHYRDWFLASTKCPPPPNQSFVLAQKSDRRATTAKELFVGRFDQLAATLRNKRQWTAGDF
jgi:hypothetical protein